MRSLMLDSQSNGGNTGLPKRHDRQADSFISVHIAAYRRKPVHIGTHLHNAFTLVELLIVVIIIALLIALLAPALATAMRAAREASVQSEMTIISQALVSYKNTNGVYPPSRVVLIESGIYFPSSGPPHPLASRTVAYLRRIWPKAAFPPPPGVFYDFNGNGVQDTAPTVIQGTECLVWFLSGLPYQAPAQAGSGWNTVGFAKDLRNPFQADPLTGSLPRWPKSFEFNPARLVDLDGNGYPEYLDALSSGKNGHPLVYFSAYEGQGYDPDDVNFVGPMPPAEIDDATALPLIGAFFCSNHPTNAGTASSGGSVNIITSLSPNPYYNDTPLAVNPDGTLNLSDSRNRVAEQPTTYQLISAGADGVYGLGGQYANDAADNKLPWSNVATAVAGLTGQTLGTGVRDAERDNLSNWHGGRFDR